MLITTIECVDLDAELAFFRTQTPLRIHLVSPADDPRRAVLRSPSGGSIELVRADSDRPAVLAVEVPGGDPTTLTSPGGSLITIGPAEDASSRSLGADMEVPPNVPTLSVVEPVDGSFGVGRAGMEYRDLLPDRWGGRFIASNIRITGGGNVDDWVHFHRIRFQMIYVSAGWVDVVYEDQGAPFRMEAGDCVLQPPEIRHRVLRSSPGLEVIEIGCPAEHDTIADHVLELPNRRVDPGRDFSGQRFVRHIASRSEPSRWSSPHLLHRDTGIAEATDGLADAVVVTPATDAGTGGVDLTHDGEFVLLVGLSGSSRLETGGRTLELLPRSAIAIPARTRWTWAKCSDDHSALVVTMPANTLQLV